MNVYLKPGVMLDGKYRIEHILGVGGFGITYLAFDTSLEKYVAIKEFFPKEYCQRQGDSISRCISIPSNVEFISRLEKKFIKEARNIAKLDNPNIIRIYACFKENDTAYYVMEYIEGESLSDMVKRGGPLNPAVACEYISKVGRALEYIHGMRINHLDIKPANIMIRRSDNSPILIDFGLSKQYKEEDGNSTTTSGLSKGYAPIEQYKKGGVGEFSPQTDIYSLAGTLYYLLVGKVPPEPTDIMESGLPFPNNFPQRLIPVISRAMSLRRQDRQPTVREFIADINNAMQRGVTQQPVPQPIPPYPKPLKGNTQSRQSRQKPLNQQPPYQPITQHSQQHQNQRKTEKTVILPKQQPNGDQTPNGTGYRQQVIDTPYERPRPTSSSPNKALPWVLAIGGAIVLFILLFIFSNSDPEQGDNAYDVMGDKVDFSSDATPEQKKAINDLLKQMVYVEGGDYQMGNDKKEALIDEKPVHTESVGSLWVDRYELTEGMWKAIMGMYPSDYHHLGDNYPARNFKYTELQVFVERLNQLSGLHFRLLTEPEWEYLARGGNLSHGYAFSGGNDINEVGWYATNSNNQPMPVGQKRPNELGLYDMSGNIGEWTSDLSSQNYDSPRSGTDYVYRGGMYNNDPKWVEVTRRRDWGPSGAHFVGTRLAMDP